MTLSLNKVSSSQEVSPLNKMSSSQEVSPLNKMSSSQETPQIDFKAKSSWSDTYSQCRSKLQLTNFIPQLRHAVFLTKHIKKERLSNARSVLSNYGGQFKKIQTSDKQAVLDACLIKPKDFRGKLIEKGCKFSRLDNGTPILVLPNSYLARSDILEEMKVNPSRIKTRSARINDDDPVDRESICYPLCKRTEYYIPLRTNSKATKLEQEGKTVVVPFGGNAMSYEMDRRKIFECLLMGMSVLVCNPRGYGHSTGTPSELGLYNDVDSIHQFKQTVDHTDTVFWGYCQGAAPASYGASQYASDKTHFIGERCFAKESDILGDIVESFLSDESIDETVWDLSDKCSKCERVITFIGKGLKLPYVKAGVVKLATCILKAITPTYDNANRVKKMRGSVLLVHGTKDDLVNEKTKQTFQKQVKRFIPKDKRSIIEEKGLEHCGMLSEKTYDLIAGHLNTQKLTANYPSDDIPDHRFYKKDPVDEVLL